MDESPSLTDFRFSATRCGREGCVEIGTALKKCPLLVRVDLSDNTWGEEGGVALAGYVTCCCCCCCVAVVCVIIAAAVCGVAHIDTPVPFHPSHSSKS